VKFGNVAGTIIIDAGSYILASSPAGAKGSVDVTVTTAYGESATSLADRFTYIAPPTTGPVSYTVAPGETLSTTAANGVLAGDTDPQGLPLTAALLSLPAEGTLAFNADGSFTYTPNGGYVGPDSFTYQASNGYAVSPPTTVNIDVTPASLVWMPGQSGNWTAPLWGAGTTYPGSANAASVSGSGSIVSVTGSQAAGSLGVQSGAEVAVTAGGSLTVTTNTSVTGGATLSVDPAGMFSTGGTLTMDTGGSVTGGLVYAAAFQLNDGTASADLSGPGGVTKDTGGTVTLSGVNAYLGATVVDNGTLIVSNAYSLPDGSSLTVGMGTASLFGAAQTASATASPAASPVAASAAPATPAPAAAASAPVSSPAAAPDAPAQAPAPVHARHLGNLPHVTHAAVDAVFSSHRAALCPALASSGHADAERPSAWLAAVESFWNSTDKNGPVDPHLKTLDAALARFGT
jgi:autotransporter-associated beta strand protein